MHHIDMMTSSGPVNFSGFHSRQNHPVSVFFSGLGVCPCCALETLKLRPDNDGWAVGVCMACQNEDGYPGFDVIGHDYVNHPGENLQSFLLGFGFDDDELEPDAEDSYYDRDWRHYETQ